jgi:hypothetical protein
MELSDENETDDEGGDDSEVENSDVLAQKQLLMGKRCHTEFGDGVIIGAGAMSGKDHISRVHVRLDDGTTARGLRATNVFIITRKETNSIDMRNKLAQAAGLKITGDITVPGTIIRETRLSVKEQRELERQRVLEERKKNALIKKKQKAISIELEFNVVNGYARFAYIGDDERTTKALEAIGFKLDQPYYYTRIRSYKHLINQANAWAAAKFETTNQVDNDALEMLAAELARGGLQTHHHYNKMISGANFKNYLRTIFKPTSDKRLLNMFAMITDGGEDDPMVIRQAEKAGVKPGYAVAYLCLPAGSGHPGSKLAIQSKYKMPATRWYLSNPTLSLFVGNIRGAQKALQQIKDAGIQITNIAELNKMAKSVKRASPKLDKHVDVQTEDDEA